MSASPPLESEGPLRAYLLRYVRNSADVDELLLETHARLLVAQPAGGQDPDRRLWFSAAVGGAVPVLETFATLRDRVQEVRGVINGTCNSVLDALAGGHSFDTAVRAAQVAGFAQANPLRDLSGADTADKLSLMVHAAFGVNVPPGRISTRGLDGTLIADDTHRWRLIARAKRAREGVTVSVTPEQVLRTSFLG